MHLNTGLLNRRRVSYAADLLFGYRVMGLGSLLSVADPLRRREQRIVLKDSERFVFVRVRGFGCMALGLFDALRT